jgi:4-hydroxyphenylpyruvate dioxygenase
MSRFKHSIASVSLSGTLVQKMKAVAKAGYDGIELFENDLTISDLKPTDLKHLAADLGIEIAALQPFRDYEAMPKDLHLKSLYRAERKFDLMEKLGTNRLFVCSNCSPQAIDDMDLAAEQLYVLAEMATKRGFQVAYEALSWGRFVNLYHQSIEIVKRANHPNLGNLLDSYHIGFMAESMDAIYDIPKEKLAFVQVADAHYFDMSAIHVGRHLRCFPGQGTFPVVEYMQAVAATGYDGYISHEIFSDDFRAASLEATAADGKRSLVWLENAVNYERKTSNFKPQISNLINIEFTTDFISQQNLVELLLNLGFQETYNHKNKDVSLYQIGEITIVLNREKNTESDKSKNRISAIGYVAENAKNLENYAEKLNYEWVKSTAVPTNWRFQPSEALAMCCVILLTKTT